MQPFLSICIPAYSNKTLVKQCLESIAIQTFKDFEVIITDDSKDDSLIEVVNEFKDKFPLAYYHNSINLGSPSNWNKAIELSKGAWIKILHYDDWFSSTESLQIIVDNIKKYPTQSFFFCAFTDNFLWNGTKKIVSATIVEQLLLRWNPLVLFQKVIIGNPSCTIVKREIHAEYDVHLKWAVDFEYYLRMLKATNGRFKFIAANLMNIGFHEDQITQAVTRNPEVNITESHYLLQKLGGSILKNIFVYDYYWRLYRNFKVNSVEELSKYKFSNNLPTTIKNIIKIENKIGFEKLNNGISSKIFMLLSYLRLYK